MAAEERTVIRERRPRTPTVDLNVTQEVIDESIQRDSSHCMIAEAVRLAVPTAQRISVDLQTIRFSDPDRNLRYTYLTPRTAQVALINYDQGRKPEAFSIQLRRGQVTKANPRKAGRPRTGETDAQRKQRLDALKKATLRMNQGEADRGTVPDKIGGSTPPVMGMAKRRSFGLRGLEL